MQALAPAANVLSTEQWLGIANSKLKELLAQDEAEHDADRTQRLLLIRRNLLYYEGKQYIARKLNDLGQAYWEEVVDPSGDTQIATGYNIILADGIKFIAATGQQLPHAKAVPRNPESAKNVEQARNADIACRWFREYWDLDRRSRDFRQVQWTAGTGYLLTLYVADEAKHGSIPLPSTDESAAPETVPGGAVELALYTNLEVAVPTGAKTIADCRWVVLEYVEHRATLLSIFPELADKEGFWDQPATGAEAGATKIAQDSLDISTSPFGSPRAPSKFRHRYRRTWLRPSQYNLTGDGTRMGANLRQQLLQQYPQGCCISWIDNKAVGMRAAQIDEEWTAFKSGTTDYLTGPSLCDPLIQMQNDINDLLNLTRESALRQIPRMIVHPALLDKAALQNREAMSADFLLALPTAGGDFSKMIAQVPTARISDQITPFLDQWRRFTRDVGGVQEALSGQGPVAPTFREARQRRDQALMQFQPSNDEVLNAVEGAFRNGIRLMARFGLGTITQQTQAEGFDSVETLDWTELQEDGWDIEVSPDMPMSAGEEADKFADLLKNLPPDSPIFTQMDITHPVNVPRTQQLLGLPGYYSRGTAEKARILRTIRQLMDQQPVSAPDPMDPTGQNMIQQPSLPPDPLLDKDAAFTSDVVRAWLIGPGDKDEIKQTPGYQNVYLYLQALEQMMAPPPMPPDPNAPPAPGGGLSGPAAPTPLPGDSAGAPSPVLGLPPLNQEAPDGAAPAVTV